MMSKIAVHPKLGALCKAKEKLCLTQKLHTIDEIS